MPWFVSQWLTNWPRINSDTFPFWPFPILTLSNFFQNGQKLDSDTFRFWLFPISSKMGKDWILTLSDSDPFQFWLFPISSKIGKNWILILSNSDTFQSPSHHPQGQKGQQVPQVCQEVGRKPSLLPLVPPESQPLEFKIRSVIPGSACQDEKALQLPHLRHAEKTQRLRSLSWACLMFLFPPWTLSFSWLWPPSFYRYPDVTWLNCIFWPVDQSLLPWASNFLPLEYWTTFTFCTACRKRTATHLTGSHRWSLVGDVINKIKIKINTDNFQLWQFLTLTLSHPDTFWFWNFPISSIKGKII